MPNKQNNSIHHSFDIWKLNVYANKIQKQVVEEEYEEHDKL